MSFAVDCLTSINSIPVKSRVHVIGICGVAMAQIALQLSKLGFEVSGSDKEYFEPMSSLLKSSSITCHLGYDKKNISSDISLVVIGNSVTASNPEVLETSEKALAYTIFPKLLSELVIAQRHSIVVSGTHGKTTTSGMLAFVLEQMSLAPSYFVGGKAEQLSSGLKVGSGLISVVEGDEYDSSFFAKFAKFHFYQPNTLIITSIEFDHADIYANLEAIKNEFARLVNTMPQAGVVIACIDDAGVRDFISSLPSANFKLITYGESPSADVVIKFIVSKSGALAANFISHSGQECEITLGIPGRYNLKNAVAGLLALESAKVSLSSELFAKFSEFKGVNRRQQLWLNTPITLIEDFAHHPTAVRETLRGIKEWLPGRRLIAIFEPRSSTSRKKIFESEYVSAFKEADLVVMKEVEARVLDNSDDLFDVETVCQAINQQGVAAKSFKEVDQIENWLLEHSKDNDIVVVMSNGAFGGLIRRLSLSLASK